LTCLSKCLKFKGTHEKTYKEKELKKYIKKNLQEDSLRKEETMEFTNAIEGKNIEKKFKHFELNIERLNIPEGFATALIGENGAGKSTLLNMLSGVRRDGKGDVKYFGHESDIENVKEKIGYTGTENYFLPNWSGKQVKDISKLLFDDFDEKKFESIADALAIDKDTFAVKGKTVSKLSDGNKVKLMLATVLARNTQMLILDEPASPLDPLMREKLSDILRSYIAAGDGKRTVFFSTHNISDMENVTDYAIIMEKGKIVEEGFVDELKEKYICVKGDLDSYNTASKLLFTCTKNNYGYEGITLAENLNKFAGLDVVTETPTLFQISVAVMKQNSSLGNIVL